MKTFDKPNNLLYNISMKYVCNFCGKEFSSKRELAELL